MKVLISGWFSFKGMGVTAGDLITCELVCKWLNELKIDFDISSGIQNLKGIPWEKSRPQDYSHVIFICGPFGNGWPVTEFLDYFKKSKLIGLNLSLIQPLEEWNPFNFLIERDSNKLANPDLAFGTKITNVPVVGIIRVHKQKEYGEKAKHEIADAAIKRLIDSREMAIINIDTSLENNQYGLRTSNEIESLIAKTDVVITTRLHGMVLSLKNGVPAIAIDPISGGAKIYHQAKIINWPYIFKAEELYDTELNEAFEACLSVQIRDLVIKTVETGNIMIKQIEKRVKKYLSEEQHSLFSAI